MKRLLIIIAVVSFALPAVSADVDFYGDIGMGAWWMNTERFYEDSVAKDTMIDTTIIVTDTTFDTTITKIWDKDSLPLIFSSWIPFGKFGINLKGDRFGGCVEFGIFMNTYDAKYKYNPTTHHFYQKRTFAVSMRKWYAEWYINDIFTFLIGKNTAPACFFPSNQAFYGGNGFNNIGCLYTGSHPMFQISAHDPNSIVEGKIAAIKPDTTLINFTSESHWYETYFGETRAPKVEGSFAVNVEKEIFSLNCKVGGGFQRYYVVVFNAPKLTKKESRIDINCWVFGGDFKVRFGPVTVAYDIFYGQNVGAYGVYVGDRFQWWYITDYIHPFYPAYDEEKDKLKNGKVLEMAAIVNVKPWEFLSFEAGVGGVIGDHDYKLYKEKWSHIWKNFGTIAWYFQVEGKFLEHLRVTPEIGQYWYGPHLGFGRYIYWGLNTIIDF